MKRNGNNNGTVQHATAHRQPQRRNNAQKRHATPRNAHRTNATTRMRAPTTRNPETTCRNACRHPCQQRAHRCEGARMPNPTQRRATRTAPTRTNDARTAHPGNRAHRAPTRAPCAPLPETKRTRTRATTTNWVSLVSLEINLHNSTFVLVGMIFILSSTLVLQYFCTIVSLNYSIFVLQYTSTIVGLYYSTLVLQYNCIVVRLYYSIFVLQYACTIENDSHYQ
jgi:hypothetical protein